MSIYGLKIGELYEMSEEVYSWYFEIEDGSGDFIPEGDVVKVIDLYWDEGVWGDDNPAMNNQVGFPAAVVEWNGRKYSSIHQECFKPLGWFKVKECGKENPFGTRQSYW